jgi:RND family efflux transporter MFP subunit
MRSSILYLFPFLLLLAACGGGGSEKSSGDRDKDLAALEALRKDRAALDSKIKDLEAATTIVDSNAGTPVSVTVAQPGSFNAYIDVQALVEGDQNVLATPQAPGVVTSISVREGQRVSKGQTIATLDDAAMTQSIKSLEAQLDLAKQLYEKQQKLYEKQIGSQVQLLSAKAQYESTLSQRAALIAQRNMYRIVAPISGTVDNVGLSVGDIASPGGGGPGSTAGIMIVNGSDLKVTANLGENNLGKVHVGDPVKIVMGENDTLNGKLSFVAQSISSLSRSFKVEVKMPSNSRLSPNMSTRLLIRSYDRSNTISVPVSVVKKTGQGNSVFIVDGAKQAKEVFVTVGKSYNGVVELLAGVSPGDKIITEGYNDLENGQKVSIQ